MFSRQATSKGCGWEQHVVFDCLARKKKVDTTLLYVGPLEVVHVVSISRKILNDEKSDKKVFLLDRVTEENEVENLSSNRKHYYLF